MQCREVGLKGKISEWVRAMPASNRRRNDGYSVFVVSLTPARLNPEACRVLRPQLLSCIPSVSIITNFLKIHRCTICSIPLSFYNAAFKSGIMPKWSRPTAFTVILAIKWNNLYIGSQINKCRKTSLNVWNYTTKNHKYSQTTNSRFYLHKNWNIR